MSKKEFIIPLVSIVLLVLIGVLLVANSKNGTPTPGTTATTTDDTASSTISTSQTSTSGTTNGTNVSNASYYPYGTIMLSLNQPAGFKDGIAIRPIAVLEDSRCPQDVQCIQAGTVRLSLRTLVTGVTKVVEVTLNAPITVGNNTITLTDVTPVPRTDKMKPDDAAYHVTFTVTPGKEVSTSPQCYVGGCSAELCTDEPGAISTCIYRDSYACYKKASCERQTSGKCGWTQTDELATCLANPPAAS